MRGEEFNDYIYSVCYGRLGVKWMAIEVWTTATADNNSQMCFYLVKLLQVPRWREDALYKISLAKNKNKKKNRRSEVGQYD